MYILSWKNPPKLFRFVNLLLENKILPLWILRNCVTPLQCFNAIFLAKSPDSPWLFGTQVPWLSLTLARNELKSSHIFLTLNTRSLKNIQAEDLHNFKEILLVMYVYHKPPFTFEVSFSTSTYDARWMCFNFTYILMNIVRSIDLHNSL